MKRYRFRLEQVLRVRRLQEEQARNEVGLARRAAEAAMAERRARSDAYQQRIEDTGPASTTVFLTRRAIGGYAARSVVESEVAEREAMAASAARLAAWSVAAGRVTALERLDERRRDEHRSEALREQEKAVDDLVLARRLQRGRR
jgi:flagellar biosynthesis chaperone FliJ